MNISDELMQVFQEEAEELIDKIAVQLEALQAASPEQYQDLLNNVSRIVHNLKGASRTVGIDYIEGLSHAMEDALEPCKKDQAALTGERVRTMLEAATVMQLFLDGKGDRSKERELIARLRGGSTPPPPQFEPEGASDKQADAAVEKGEHPAATTGGGPTARVDEGASIRVDTTRFDRVMGFSGELLISHARMAERHRRLDNFLKELQRVAKQLPESAHLFAPLIRDARPLIQEDRKDLLDFGHLTTEINDAMKQVRMVPLKRAEPGWRRIVREAAHQCGKRIELSIHAGDIELDKHVLDLLRDPMMHLLRNAVDHGIESAEDRIARAKPVSGHIYITASVLGAMVELEVGDDGRGIALPKVRESGVAKGIIDADKGASLSDEETMELLFHPGFSTAGSVSELSGRGVGLDVVRSQVEELGGRVVISSSEVGGGTSFVLSVPLSILSTLGLFVRSGGTTYALPAEYVTRTLRVKRTELDRVDGKPVVEIAAADPIRIVWLSELVGASSEETEEMLKVVVLTRSEVQLGLVVEEIEGQQEFVTKALPWNFQGVPGVNGAIIRADGRLAVSIDVPYLFDDVRFAFNPKRRKDDGKTSNTKRKILVVDDSMSSRTLEQTMLQEAGYDVSIAVDGEAAWQLLEKEPFDLVVSDVDMPNLSGLGLVRRVRRSRTLNDLPVILVTGMSSPDDVAAGADAGADEYVVKGTFDQQTLLELVAKYI